MADSLFLRKGLLANLESAPKVAGAISITTDERAMYLDLSDTERIRIGDFIQVANVTELKSDKYKPWSTTAFYYVEDVNGLYKYNGTDWKLINEKSDFSSDISSLQTTVAGHATDISGLKDSVAANAQAISDEATRADTAEKALGQRIDETNTAVTGVANDLATEVTRAKAAEKANADNITALQTGKQDKITGAASTVVTDQLTASKVLMSDASGKIAVSDLDATQLAYLSDVTGNIQSQINGINTAHSGLVTTVSNLDAAYKAADAGFETRIKALEDAEEKATAEELARVEREYKAADVTINEKITALQEKDTSIDTTIAGINNTISGLEGDISDLETTISNGDTATLNSAKEYADGKVAAEAQARETAISNLDTAYKAADESLNTAIAGANAAVSAEKTRAEGQEAAIRSEFAAADTALEERVTEAYEAYVESKLQAADAMRFMGVITNANKDTVVVTPVEAGHTYKIGEDLLFNNIQCYVGDLIIADADQEGDTYTGTWSHVSSGYEASFDPSLIGNATDKAVILRNGVEQEVGKIVFTDSFNGNNGGIQYSVIVDGNTTTVTSQMVWGSF